MLFRQGQTLVRIDCLGTNENVRRGVSSSKAAQPTLTSLSPRCSQEFMKLVTSSLALLAVLSSCESDPEAPVASTLTIAFEGPLTGDQASNGQDMFRGVRLAVPASST